MDKLYMFETFISIKRTPLVEELIKKFCRKLFSLKKSMSLSLEMLYPITALDYCYFGYQDLYNLNKPPRLPKPLKHRPKNKNNRIYPPFFRPFINLSIKSKPKISNQKVCKSLRRRKRQTLY